MHEPEPAGPSGPSRWRRRGARALAGLIAIGVAAGTVLGVQGFVLYDAVAQIQERSGTLVGMASRLDFAGAEVALGEIADDAAIAASASSGPLWVLAEQLPVIGDDLAAVSRAVAVLDDLASISRDTYSATGLVDGIAALLPREGRFDLNSIDGLITAVDAIDAAAAEAAERIAEIDRSGLIGPVRGNIDTISRLLDSIPGQLDEARTALGLVAAALGADGPRTVLVVLRDSAQDWASGGAPLAVAQFDVVDGRVDFVRSAAASDLVDALDPVEAAQSEWEQISTMRLATVPTFAPLASALASSWGEQFGASADLVVSLDTVGLETITQYVGVDAAQLPQPESWADAAPRRQQAALADAMVALLDGVGGASGFLDLAAELFGGRRVQVWSSHENEMELIGAYPTVAGEIEPAPDRLLVLLDGESPSATGASELAAAVTVCSEESTVRVELGFSDAAAGATVWVVGPLGAESIDVEEATTLGGAPVVELLALPGDTVSVTFRVDALLAQPRLGGLLIETAAACA